MYLLIKEIDTFKSTRFKGKTLTQSIIYVMDGNRPIVADLFIHPIEKLEIINRYRNQYQIENIN